MADERATLVVTRYTARNLLDPGEGCEAGRLARPRAHTRRLLRVYGQEREGFRRMLDQEMARQGITTPAEDPAGSYRAMLARLCEQATPATPGPAQSA